MLDNLHSLFFLRYAQCMKKLLQCIFFLCLFSLLSQKSFAAGLPNGSTCSQDKDCQSNYCATSYSEVVALSVCEDPNDPANPKPTPSPTPTPTVAPPAPCNKDSQGNCVSVNTGFGEIPISITAVISTVFAILLSLSGGIILIIIVFSGYRLMTSQGDPEKIKGARETLTSAIIGLLFVIFSVTILQVIGVDILHIPGFTH